MSRLPKGMDTPAVASRSGAKMREGGRVWLQRMAESGAEAGGEAEAEAQAERRPSTSRASAESMAESATVLKWFRDGMG